MVKQSQTISSSPMVLIVILPRPLILPDFSTIFTCFVETGGSTETMPFLGISRDCPWLNCASMASKAVTSTEMPNQDITLLLCTCMNTTIYWTIFHKYKWWPPDFESDWLLGKLTIWFYDDIFGFHRSSSLRFKKGKVSLSRTGKGPKLKMNFVYFFPLSTNGTYPRDMKIVTTWGSDGGQNWFRIKF